MEKLRKQINESFFNPVLHLLPLILFLVTGELYSFSAGIMVSSLAALLLIAYMFFVYRSLFKWHLVFVAIFVCVIFISTIGGSLPEPFRRLSSELVVLFFLLCMILFHRQLQKYTQKLVPGLIPMTNNCMELNRSAMALAFVLFVYISAVLARYYYQAFVQGLDDRMLMYAYAGILAMLVFYETIRVLIVRATLMKEEWWPIVSDQGKIIGSIHHQTSLHDTNKYKHPVIRVMLIDRGMVLLQKISKTNPMQPGMWDSAISNHVKINETIDQCVNNTAFERYELKNFKYMYLSNYSLELPDEHQYAFFFVSCQLVQIKPNLKYIDQAKWWTQKQIEDNLGSGIFSENFKIEYDLLKRSGLLETGRCECSCRLKEEIYGKC